jgi:hypothetical protein
MQLSAARSLQVRCSQNDRSASVVACPTHVLAANRATIAQRQPSAHSICSPQQQQGLRSSVLVRSTPVDAAAALKAPGQGLAQVSFDRAAVGPDSWTVMLAVTRRL